MRCKIWQRLGYLLPESAMDVNSWSLLKISNGIDIPSCYTLDKICILPGRDRRIEVFEMFDLEKQRSMVASCWLCSLLFLGEICLRASLEVWKNLQTLIQLGILH